MAGFPDIRKFRSDGHKVIDYLSDYVSSLRERPPRADVKVGFVINHMAKEAPLEGHSWEEIQKDLDDVLFPGLNHFQSPSNCSLVPYRASHPSVLGQLIMSVVNGASTNWSISPSGIELEMVVMNWIAKAMGLPDDFLFSDTGKGGGVTQSSGTDCTHVAMVAARHRAIQRLQDSDVTLTKGQALDKLVAYVSDQAHACFVKSATACLIRLKILPTNDDGSLSACTLRDAINADLNQGYIPFFVGATVGSTSTCSCDNLEDIGQVCNQHNIWLHADAAYAGLAAICPEYRHLLAGVEHCMTISMNPYKWMGITHDCAAVWIKDSSLFADALRTTPAYLRHMPKLPSHDYNLPNFADWQMPTARGLRSLKLWMTMQMTGLKNMQAQLRKDMRLAKEFERLVDQDSRFEIFGVPALCVVCFRLKGDNAINQRLFSEIESGSKLFMTVSERKDIFFLRFVVSSSLTESGDVIFAWNVIQEATEKITKLHVNGHDNGELG